jgi:hypothetical protein
MHIGDFRIKGLSECIEVSSKRKITTEVLPVTREIVVKILKKDGWSFDWKKEFKLPDRHLFYLRTCMEDGRVQGIISATPMIEDRFIFLNLIESAPHNLGSKKQYEGIAVNLVAYMCKASFDLGLDGFVVFIAKTAMIDHYIKKFGAELVNPRRNSMCIGTKNAEKLVNLYIKNL